MFASFMAPQIRSERDLRKYITHTTICCLLAALAIDIVNQGIFFQDWAIAIRSWLITICISAAICIPTTYTIGKAHLALFRASRTDFLTGLPNRHAIFDHASNPGFAALAILDIDRFKSINDTYGHIAGDVVLKAVASVMRTQSKATSLVGRLGGEEFVILFFESDETIFLNLIESIRQYFVKNTVSVNDDCISVTISAGIAQRAGNENFQNLYSEADKALYEAKNTGRNKVVLAKKLEYERYSRFDQSLALPA